MAFDIFRLAGRVILNSSEALTGLRNVENAATRTGAVFKKVGGTITSAGKSMTTFVTLPVLAGIAGAIKQASDMNETISKTRVVFKDGADAVLKWSDQTLKSIGLAKGTSLDMAATFGDMGTAMGLTDKKAQEMAIGLTNLTGDMASFKNMKPEEIHIALAGAYTGETEALKRLGIVMTVANLERFAATQGIKKQYKEMTEAEKIQLRYNYIMKASKNSIGDFKRTQKSAANQTRIFTEGLKEAGGKIGTLFLPYFTKAIQFVNKLMDRFHNLSPAMQKAGVIIALLAAGIGPLLVVIGTLITFIGGIVTAIGTIGLPVTVAIAALIPFIAVWGTVITTIAAVIYKTGILQKAFNFLKNIFEAVKAVLQGKLTKAFDILVSKLGLSRKQAITFIKKLTSMKNTLKKVATLAKNVGKLIKAIFSGDKQKVINLLIKKFGLTKKEAKKFWKEVDTLKKNVVKLAKKVKSDIIPALGKFADKIKGASKWIIDHRKQIAKAISIVIKLATYVVNSARRAYNAAKWFVKFASRVNSAMNKARSTVVRILSSINSKMKGAAKGMWRAGYNAVKAFGNGISAAYSWVKNKVSSIAGLVGKFLGFHSPTEEGPGRDADEWGPNFMKMLASGIESKKGLLRDTMNKVAGELDVRGKINDFAIAGKGQQGSKVILQINNPKFFNQQDINKMMEPVVKRLDFMGLGSR